MGYRAGDAQDETLTPGSLYYVFNRAMMHDGPVEDD